jgi:hypothetical protein
MRANHAARTLAFPGKRELNEDETARLKQLWKKLVRMFHPDLHGGAHAPPRVVFSASLKTGVCYVGLGHS